MNLKPLPNALFRVDTEADAAYIYLDGPTAKGEVAHTIEVTKNVYIDFAADGRVLGIELLRRDHFPKCMKGETA